MALFIYYNINTNAFYSSLIYLGGQYFEVGQLNSYDHVLVEVLIEWKNELKSVANTYEMQELYLCLVKDKISLINKIKLCISILKNR